ncbi:nucleotide sugar dehydrogenase [Chelativorans sp. AA-79]|uniref:nucleotide sugar dehydrogenase n=1 Tax=Chelativorans sp. AA-79 TaxID=3028735 RepID=UPI0023F76CD7|nr:nucleotide sugar dehydrogenase [Chelativorans sp. AA-79]WEX09055.1 nucleotide sugar dehydrogenase [Chelativorans sp. AA-79]
MNIVGNLAFPDFGVLHVSLADQLRRRLESCEACIGILGLGYVGLPLVPAIARVGYNVVGFDIDGHKITELSEGRSYIRHISNETVATLVSDGRFTPTSDFSRLCDVDVLLICVPTPLTRNRDPDLSFVISTTEAIAQNFRPGQLIVLESTTYPGTTREVMRPILERTGLLSGSDFFLAYSPEREDPGNSLFNTAQIPKVIGGDGDAALELACLFYSRIVAGTVPVSSVETAEAVKLTENIFRTVNIALVNELKLLFERMGIDIWEVIDAAKTKPFGYMAFYPGPGLGGHCLPIDPFYLTWKAREYGIATRFIELAGEINTAMPGHVVDRLANAINEQSGKGLKGAKILILGVAYKKDVDDTRESPALRIIELLQQRGAVVDYHDPYVQVIPNSRDHPELSGKSSVALEPETLANYAAAMICTDHSNVDYNLVLNHTPIVIDTRNACRSPVPGAHRLVRA